MTSLVAWTGVDSRGPASFYLASDSRISWEPDDRWDFGRKIFASSRHPEIVGYYGDVLFTSQILAQVVSLVDSDALFSAGEEPEARFQAISAMIRQAHLTYPHLRTAQRPLTVVYCCRRNDGMATSFALFELTWSQAGGWRESTVPVPVDRSDVVAVYGSGKESVEHAVGQWEKSAAGGTSRSVFSAFCDSLTAGMDPRSGGAPQLAGVYRKWNAKSFGIIYNARRYLHGLCVDGSACLDTVEWRNELFERCDWKKMTRLAEAQPQPRPFSVNSRES